ncbi:MAG: terminase gpA endonuclease subunit, partial [Planctomycetota bacterium]
VEIVGWGERLESWSIDWVVLDGDTAKAETWEQLDKLLAQTWPHANGGELGIARLAVDAGDGSYSAPTIHRWAREKLPRVMPVRGRGSATQLVYQRREATLRKGKSARGRMGTFWPVGVGLIKSELYAALRLEEPAAGDRVPSMWCHFPQKYDDEYFKQLTSERKTIRPNAKGIPTSNWRVLEGRRNEVLDCRVYARAAAYVLGVDTWSAEKWEHERAATRPAKEAQKPPTRRRVRRDSGFIEPRRQGWLDGK